jgi:hypothetical protein
VTQERPACREHALAHRGLPVEVGERRVDLADHGVDHAVEHLVLVGHVLVERHRDDTELLCDLPHAE